MPTGAERLTHALSGRGLTHVFGVPGTQNVSLFEGLGRSGLRTVLTTHELNAAFMAVGFFRASGRPAAVASIPGPGFTHALSGLVEARHDSAALLHVVGPPSSGPGERFRLQAIDQATLGRVATKGVFEIASLDDLERIVHAAWTHAVTGEPGPVVLHLPPSVLEESGPAPPETGRPAPTDLDDDAVARVSAMLARGRRPVLLVGQGGLAAAPEVVRLAELLNVPVVTSCAGRGVIPEDHPLAVGFDVVGSSVDALNEGLASADCILVLGYKLTHNGTAGFRIRLPSAALVHVDADPEIPGANYPVAEAITADVGDVARRLVRDISAAGGGAGAAWTAAEIAEWRDRLASRVGDDVPEPRIGGVSPPTAKHLFTVLRRVLSRETILVTDSGLHQVLVRRYYPVLSPRGLIVPNDYQSMGFGIPAAIGAKLGAPDRPVVAIVGDGGFAMTGLELLTAAREHVPLTVIVFNDGYLNLIRLQQLGASGTSTAVRLQNPDFELMAHAVGADYRLFDGEQSLAGLDRPGARPVRLVEVRLGDTAAIAGQRYAGFIRASAKRALGPSVVQRLKRWMGR